MATPKRFEVLEWRWARVSDVYRYHREGMHAADWGIKGHNRPWVITEGRWEKGMRFLDIGAGFSDVAFHLAERHDMEGWVADDFGTAAGEEVWARWGNPEDLKKKFPRVRYVFQRVGDPPAREALPRDYFDRIYSISTLEHIPRHRMKDVFDHMADLLKPGGLMLHAVDIPIDLPFEKKVSSDLSRRPLLKGLAGLAWNFASHWPAVRLVIGNDHYPATAGGWARFLKHQFRIVAGKSRMRSACLSSVLLDPDILMEPIDVEFKYYRPAGEPKPFRRILSLVFILRAAPG